MNGRVLRVTGHLDAAILEGWEVASAPAGSIADPVALEDARLAWIRAPLPTTVAGALRSAEQWNLDAHPRRFDAEDWWWKVRFPSSLVGDAQASDLVLLCFDGLATLADVWLNGEHLLETDNMFVGYQKVINVADRNELIIRCRSLDAALKAKRPRPRWRAPMIEHPQLRFLRTTLLGRTPGWSPPAAPVGPWRPIRLVRQREIAASDVSLRTTLAGNDGDLFVTAVLTDLVQGKVFAGRAEIVLSRGEQEIRATLRPAESGRHEGHLRVEEVERWWPHTHGEPALYAARLEVGASVVDLGNVGFREIGIDRSRDGFAIHVNGVRVFCRGACWTPLDPVTLTSASEEIAAALEQVVRAGMNMLRVSGTMVYETDAFYAAADAAGILVWQELMFANMDYPEDEPAFRESVEREVRQQLRRLQGRPCVAVICGNSEGEQQAAMFGASRERWSPRLFHDTFSTYSREILPDVPYWPSSAHGGAFPHQGNCGTTSYYGVGAYERPLEDARLSEVRFATECLAFANVPAVSTIAKIPGGESSKVHNPAWKARVPRDLGAGWDFDDVRDHYLSRLFRVDPAHLRYSDHERYLALGRVVTGEVMAQVFGEWRRARSVCAGGLVWFLRDLWPGAGWGVVGSDGIPKAPYYYLRRVLQPVALHMSDEGGNGIYVHAFNDGPSPVEGELEIALYRGADSVGNGRGSLVVPPRGAVEVPALSLFDGFMDLGHAYRFGPPTCDLIVATLRTGAVTTEAFFFPLGLPASVGNVALAVDVARRDNGELDLTIATRGFAQSIAIELGGYRPDDAFFHLRPDGQRTVRLCPVKGASLASRGIVSPLNAENAISVFVS